MSATLVLLAAGMSTRYGRLKQLEPVGPGGEALLDYSVFDARKTGFSRVLLVIRKELEEAFQEHVVGRWPVDLEVLFHHQELGDLPGVRDVPPSLPNPGDSGGGPHGPGAALAGLLSRRRKPWGTGHAVLTARRLLPGPFAVINADDFYGRSAFVRAAGMLEGPVASGRGATPVFALLTYTLEDTLSRHGGVSRGICQLGAQDWLTEIQEVLEIRRDPEGVRGETVAGDAVRLLGREPTSTNFWIFTPEVFPLLEMGFRRFIERLGKTGAQGGKPQGGAGASPSGEPEFLLPAEMNRILATGEARIRAVPGGERFLGITHPDDRGWVVGSLEDLVREGRYPERLWGGGAGEEAGPDSVKAG